MKKFGAAILATIMLAGCTPKGALRPTPAVAEFPYTFEQSANMGKVRVTVGKPRSPGKFGHVAIPVGVRNVSDSPADAPPFGLSLGGTDCGKGHSDTYMNKIRRGATRTAVITWNCGEQVKMDRVRVIVGSGDSITIWERWGRPA